MANLITRHLALFDQLLQLLSFFTCQFNYILLSSRHNMVSHFRFNLFSLFLLPFGIKSATLFNLVRNFNAPHRTGLEDFLHPALQ